MSYFDTLINDSFKQLHADAILAAVAGFAVNCQLIFGDTKFTDCPNCIFDKFKKRSSNVYKTGGPIPFTVGICPYCGGVGRVSDEQTETVLLAPIYNFKQWLPQLQPAVNNPQGMVQTVSKYDTTYSQLRRAKEIIINTDFNNYVRARFERLGEPEPCGFASNKIVLTMWKRIEN